MPIPVPKHVTEAWLIYEPALKCAKESTYSYEGAYDGYSNLTLEARNKAAKLLYEVLTEEQVESLRSTGKFVVRDITVVADRGIVPGHDRMYYGHPAIQHPEEDKWRCVSFGWHRANDHVLVPVCDRLLAIKLALETGTKVA